MVERNRDFKLSKAGTIALELINLLSLLGSCLLWKSYP